MSDKSSLDIAARNAELTRDMIGLAVVACDDPVAQASALLTAATVIIEREVGIAFAPSALLALLAPTFAQWNAPAPGESLQ